MKYWAIVLVGAILLAACTPSPAVPTPAPNATQPPQPTALPQPTTGVRPTAMMPEPSATAAPPAPTPPEQPSPVPTDLPMPTPAGPLVTRQAGETLDAFARRILPEGMQLAHPVLEGEFGPGAGSVVITFGAKVPGPYTVWVLAPEGGAYRQYELPRPAYLWDWSDWEVQAVTFAQVDADERAELLILNDYLSGSGPHATRVRHTWVYRWRAGRFTHLAEVSAALGSAFPARAVFERLSELGYGPLPGAPAAGDLRLGENVTLAFDAYTETNTLPFTSTITTRTPVLQGADDARIARFNRAITAMIQQEVAGFKEVISSLPPDAPVPGGYLDINAALDSPPGSRVSIELLVHGYTGGAHPYHYARTVNYDLATGQMMLLDDLFRPGAEYLPAIADYCRAELVAREVPLFEEGLAPVPDNYTHWALTAEGLLMIFNEYQVAPYAAGRQMVTVPYALLQDTLAVAVPVQNP